MSESVPSQKELLDSLDALEAQEKKLAEGELSPELKIMFEHNRKLIQSARNPAELSAAVAWMHTLEAVIRSEHQMAASRQPPPGESQGNSAEGFSQASLLNRLEALESQARQRAKGQMPLQFALLFGQLRRVINEANFWDRRSSAGAWLNITERLMSSEFGKKSPVFVGAGQALPVKQEEVVLHQVRSLSLISRDIQLKRLVHLSTWFYERAREAERHRDLLKELEQSCYELMSSTTSHERMLVAFKLDRLQEQMTRRFNVQAPEDVDALWLVRHSDGLQLEE